MNKYEKLAATMRDAVDHPGKYPEVTDEKKPATKKETSEKFSARTDWLKELEDRQDNDERKLPHAA